MNNLDFKEWPLHDAPIETFTIDWNTKTCKLTLNVFLNKNTDAVPCQIIWKELTEIYIPSKAPWGKSVFINSQRKTSENEYLIEMQSGDEIKICADQIEFKELTSDIS